MHTSWSRSLHIFVSCTISERKDTEDEQHSSRKVEEVERFDRCDQRNAMLICFNDVR